MVRQGLILKLFVVAVTICVCVFVSTSHADALREVPAENGSSKGDNVSFQNPTGTITLEDALALALQQNPELGAYQWEIRAREAAVLQAGRRINPEISVEVEDLRLKGGPGMTTRSSSLNGDRATIDVGGANTNSGNSAGVQVPLPSIKPAWETERENGAHSGLSEAQVTVILSQTVELGGKRAKRVRLAQHEKDLASWDYEVARLNVLAEVTEAFVGVVAAQARVALNEDLVEVALGSLNSIEKLADAGEISSIEQARSETALSLARVRLEQARQAGETARARLVATWGGASAEFSYADGDLTGMRPVPSLDGLYSRIERNPDLARWADELQKRAAAVAIEKANRIPNITVSIGYRRTGIGSRDISRMSVGPGTQWNVSRSELESDRDGENSLYLGVSLPLPIFDRRHGAIQEALYRETKASEERRASETSIRASLSETFHVLQAAYISGDTLSSSVIPNATRTFELMSKGYQEGEFSYIDLLDAQRTLFEARNQYLDAVESYYVNIAEVERLTGMPLFPPNSEDQRVVDDGSE